MGTPEWKTFKCLALYVLRLRYLSGNKVEISNCSRIRMLLFREVGPGDVNLVVLVYRWCLKV